MANKQKRQHDPLNDYLFLKYMGEKGDEKQLLSFINTVLKKTGKSDLKAIEILEEHKFSAEILGGKECALDVRAKFDDKTHVNIEVQLRNKGNMSKRTLYYWSRDFSSSLDVGQDYLELPKIITINIVNYELLDGPNRFHTSYRMHEDDEHEYLMDDSEEVHFIDMVKFRRIKNKDMENPMHRWLTYFDKHTKKEIIEEIIKMDPAIKEADEKIRYVLADKETFRLYEMRAKALSDYVSGINAAKREGLKEGEERGLKKGEERGLKEGEEKGLKKGEERGLKKGEEKGLKKGEEKARVEIARKLKTLNLSFNQIQESTGLSIEEIEKL
ncbi:MAG: Rpn family recombination-promoting nuclease/putative transposase [Prevotellaceae bacterium]|jgi:predicted transposase/invertase (TIGR01784 family)|nr:Rpn family recombination-promoting nuclease/putative transposase [Prevotellaceae bacterium]